MGLGYLLHPTRQLGKTDLGLRVTNQTHSQEMACHMLGQWSGCVVTQTWWVEESQASPAESPMKKHSGARERWYGPT